MWGQDARRGYAKSSAGRNAGRMMKNDEIQSAIQAAQRERSERIQITQDRVLQELARVTCRKGPVSGAPISGGRGLSLDTTSSRPDLFCCRWLAAPFIKANQTRHHGASMSLDVTR
ncbi:terminase small subunit [Ralstonia solanacearum]|uniref:Terminase small subunit n=1 Tax=Ralstonia solanacearum TaxID=305 RepID=A0AAW5ZVP8_RALSL|nr:terminase small subunit [Ralstonia solanacearum]